MRLNDGTSLQKGKYRIVRVLGQGGFGITYLAENILLAKMVAIKEFFPKDFYSRDNTGHLQLGTQNNAELVGRLKTRFVKEAQYIARLDHEGIIKIHDIFEENNTAYYVMDYIDGENLNEIVKNKGPLCETQALSYIRKVGEALGHIHAQNMTHFDVKPANIVVRKSDDMPVLIDFGLSKQYDVHGDATSTMMHGVSMGYSPIELYNPGSLSSISPQTDVYSLGATLYYLLNGGVPPAAPEILEGGLSIPREISPKIASAINWSMSISRAKRPNSVRAFLEALSSEPNSKEETIPPDMNEETAPPSINKDEKTVLINSQPKSVASYPESGGVATSETSKATSNKWWYVGICALVAIVLMVLGTGILSKKEETSIRNYVSTATSPVVPDTEIGVPSVSEEKNNSNNIKSKIDHDQSPSTMGSSERAEIKRDKKKTPSSTLSSTSSLTKTTSTGSYNYSYGTYKGELMNGKPHGKGRLTFTSAHSDNKHGYKAEMGDYIEGYFTNGVLDPGATLVKNDGSRQKIY